MVKLVLMIRHKDDIVNAVKGVDNNATPCHRTGYDKHNIRTPATQEKNWRKKKTENKTKKIKEKGKGKKEKKTHYVRKKKENTQSSVSGQWSVVSWSGAAGTYDLRVHILRLVASSAAINTLKAYTWYLVPGI